MSSSATPETTAPRTRWAWQPAALVGGAVLSLLLVAVGVLGLTGAFAGTPKSPTATNPLDGTPLGAWPPLPRVGARGDLVAPWTEGRAAVLLFFAKWCAPCHHELPALAAALGTGDIEGVQVVGVDEDLGSVAASFVKAEQVRFPVGDDVGEALAARLVPALPSAVFVRSNGVIFAVHYGALSVVQLRAEVSRLVGT